MMKTISTMAAVVLAASMLAGCETVERHSALQTSAVGAVQTAGPGDVVMDFRATRPLPNAFGKADIFGRTTDAGSTTVRYVGSQGSRAVFQRTDVMVESNATTMNQTPLIVPSFSQANVSGIVGTTPIVGSASSTSYSIVGPRPTTSYATSSAPVTIVLGAGQTARIEGHTLRVLRVDPGSVVYRLD